MQFQQRPEEGYHGTEIPGLCKLPDVRASLVQAGFELMAILLPQFAGIEGAKHYIWPHVFVCLFACF